LNPIVIDASVAAAWFMPDEKSEFADKTRDEVTEAGAVAPVLFWYELRNMLLSNERRRRLNAEEFVEALDALRALPIDLRSTRDDDICFTLARRHGLTFYDATYLALAIEEGAPMATLDKALAKAAAREGVELLS
jgi:predicted nucleic acid-binding protein